MKVAKRVLKPGVFYITYSGQYHLLEVMNRLNENLEYYWTISLLHAKRTDIIQRNIKSFFKPILIYQKPPINHQEEYISDVIQPYPRDKNLHDWQQALGEAKELLEKFTKEGEQILDPMGGSGTTAVACRELNRRCIIIEKDQESVEIIKARLSEHEQQQERKVS